MNDTDNVTPPWRPLMEQMQRHFDAAAHGQCLLWVDPTQGDPFEGRSLVEQRRVRVPIRHPRFDPSRAPYVVALDLSHGEDGDVFAASVELAWDSWGAQHLTVMLGQPICGWVSTRAMAKRVAGHWGRHCHLHLRQRETKLLRFHDPGVREWLWPCLSQTQQRALLGPAGAVHAIGRGQLLTHQSCAKDIAATPIGGDDPGEYPALLLDEKQWDELEDYAAVHAAWLALRTSRSDTPTVLQAPRWERPILQALRHATRFGLRDAADRELFALHALQLGAEFYQNTLLQEVWRKTAGGDFYGNAIEEIIGRPADQLDAFIHASHGNRNEGKHG